MAGSSFDGQWVIHYNLLYNFAEIYSCCGLLVELFKQREIGTYKSLQFDLIKANRELSH